MEDFLADIYRYTKARGKAGAIMCAARVAAGTAEFATALLPMSFQCLASRCHFLCTLSVKLRIRAL